MLVPFFRRPLPWQFQAVPIHEKITTTDIDKSFELLPVI